MDKENIRFHGFRRFHDNNVKEGDEVWCPDTLLSQSRGASTCVHFVH